MPLENNIQQVTENFSIFIFNIASETKIALHFTETLFTMHTGK